MGLICVLRDKDIGQEPIEMNENPELRLSSRGIVIREDGKIAIFNKSNKNEYKLPGGGIIVVLYYYYKFLLGLYPKRNMQHKLTLEMRQAIKKMDKYSEQVRFVCKYKIETMRDIDNVKEKQRIKEKSQKV